MMIIIITIIIITIIKPDVRGTGISHWIDPVSSLNEKKNNPAARTGPNLVKLLDVVCQTTT